MKTFNDLVFRDRGHGGIGAHHKFDNGFAISVQAGSGMYSTPRKDLTSPDDFVNFEVAVFAPNGDWATKQFFPNHNDDVLGWRDRGEINSLMLLIQSEN
jgi:hypothetical protein